jgi:hypothetical protein
MWCGVHALNEGALGCFGGGWWLVVKMKVMKVRKMREVKME